MSAIHCSKCRQELPGELLPLIAQGQLQPHAAQKPDGTATTIRLCPLCEESFRRWSSDGLGRFLAKRAPVAVDRFFIEGISILGAGHPGA
ncbi:MAG: hypothetical protein ACLQU3_33115 [Limisphaerales bacterium]